MRYIAVQYSAALELVGDRLFQSVDFPEGNGLACLLGGNPDGFQNPRVFASKTSNGVILHTKLDAKEDCIVFDLNTTNLFSESQTKQAWVQCFQKTLRFAVKYLSGNSVFNASERILHEHNIGVIFPFPISQLTGFRIVVDLKPDAERLAKRNIKQRLMLINYAGTDENARPGGTATFRKYLEERENITFSYNKGERKSDEPQALGVTSLEELKSVPIAMHQAYDSWMRMVTDSQREFIVRDLQCPARLEGPAGTGKTLCLCLKAVHDLKKAEVEGLELSILLLTHSEATRRSISEVVMSMGGDHFMDRSNPRNQLKISTLQSLCGDILGRDIQETEFLDRDALEAKNTQLLMIEEAIKSASSELQTYKSLMSPDMIDLVSDSDPWTLVEMFQHEIAVVIKGRSSQEFDIYRRTNSLSSGLPISTDGDKAFCWRVFIAYNGTLKDSGQFDTDDVVISTYLQLSAPIWKRRRTREGFDSILIDETHLFNMNELSIFHSLTKSDLNHPMAFVIDKSQAIGDRGWNEDIDFDSLIPESLERQHQHKTEMKAVFRCAPQVVNLAFTITSSGAQIFTNFHNPLDMAYSVQTFDDEKKSALPKYYEYKNDSGIVDAAFSRADSMSTELGTNRGDVAIIFFSEELFSLARIKAESDRKAITTITTRGDFESVKKAQQERRFILSLPDYVGGLEFSGVVLVGVDKGRVPATPATSTERSRAYLDYVAHNRLYVSITRAKFRVDVLGTQERGLSPFIERARDAGALEIEKTPMK